MYVPACVHAYMRTCVHAGSSAKTYVWLYAVTTTFIAVELAHHLSFIQTNHDDRDVRTINSADGSLTGDGSGDGPTLPPKVEAELIELRRQAKEVPPLREEVARLQRRLTAAQKKRGGRRGRATTAGS